MISNRKQKIWMFLVLVLSIFVVSSLSYVSPVSADTINGERVDTSGSLTVGTKINYWIDSSNEYTVSIPAAITRLMYPPGLSNNLVLNKTTVNQKSKLDFYQYSSNNYVNAYAMRFAKNSSGVYAAITVGSAQSGTNWVYGEVYINDYLMGKYTNTARTNVILHEILHVYGMNDLYKSTNKYSIMYGSSQYFTVDRNIDSTINAVLNRKYTK